MRERVLQLRGTLEREASPGSGTTLYERMPPISSAADRSSCSFSVKLLKRLQPKAQGGFKGRACLRLGVPCVDFLQVVGRVPDRKPAQATVLSINEHDQNKAVYVEGTRIELPFALV